MWTYKDAVSSKVFAHVAKRHRRLGDAAMVQCGILIITLEREPKDKVYDQKMRGRYSES